MDHPFYAKMLGRQYPISGTPAGATLTPVRNTGPALPVYQRDEGIIPFRDFVRRVLLALNVPVLGDSLNEPTGGYYERGGGHWVDALTLRDETLHGRLAVAG